VTDTIDIKERGVLDWRLREISASLEKLGQAIDANTEAINSLRRNTGEEISNVASAIEASTRGG
jgi:hypothetical protein